MVNAFHLSGIPRIIFGPGTLKKLPALLKEFGDQYLIITGATSFMSGHSGRILMNSLEGGSNIIYRGRIIKEPSPSDVDDIVKEYSGKEIDAVVGIGGGSVLDAAKAVSAMLRIGGSVREYIEGVGTRKHPGIKIPFIAVPTTAGTGSESTENAVLSEIGTNGFKRSLRHYGLVPDIALVDPELTTGCPPEITSASGMDALTQLIESYISVNANTFTDSLAEEAIRLIITSLPKAVKNGSDLNARKALSYSAMISGITLANAGLGVVHGFASSIGGCIDIPHGVLCGTLLGAANRIILNNLLNTDPVNAAVMKYAKIGMFFTETKNLTEGEYAVRFIELLEKLVEDLDLPRIGNYGLKTEMLENIADMTSQKNNPVKLSKDELLQILKARI
ncbi:MAG: iron-containing alcohol dehydrogenase [Bacteroidales bacterium]|nr:iron-containing alcohol dehydrogenase [Bacteroidales bacterium]